MRISYYYRGNTYAAFWVLRHPTIEGDWMLFSSDLTRLWEKHKEILLHTGFLSRVLRHDALTIKLIIMKFGMPEPKYRNWHREEYIQVKILKDWKDGKLLVTWKLISMSGGSQLPLGYPYARLFLCTIKINFSPGLSEEGVQTSLPILKFKEYTIKTIENLKKLLLNSHRDKLQPRICRIWR